MKARTKAILGIVLLAIGGTSYYFYSSKYSSRSEKSQSATIEPEIPSAPAAVEQVGPDESRNTGKTNRLAKEKSPYLLMHAHNPVDWYPWGDEAFAEAKRLNKPIFLSIGYSACHWCHLMLEESFSDDEVAALLNEVFVSIKVDREERPDVDAIYMKACEFMLGECGWPLNVVMTPDGKPFFMAVYMSKYSSDQYGMGIIEMAKKSRELWTTKNAEVLEVANQISESLRKFTASPPSEPAGVEALDEAYGKIATTYDQANAGFGSGGKFPASDKLMYLLRYNSRKKDPESLAMVKATLDAIRRGGLTDQVGYGVHRYTVDDEWRIPHFEKMISDQAMAATAYIEAWQATGDAGYKTDALEIFAYVLRDMRSPAGLFYTSQDADLGGVEGGYYMWTYDEFKSVVGSDAVATLFNVKPEGNMPGDKARGRNVLFIGDSQITDANMLEEARKKLFEARSKRPRPRTDTKALVDFNGLMISALAKGAAAFDDPRLLNAAVAAADILLKDTVATDGSLPHVVGSSSPGFLDDYAFLVMGLMDLYEATFDARYLEKAIAINDYMMKHFSDPESGAFFFTEGNDSNSPARLRRFTDGATPSGNSVAFFNILRIAMITGNRELDAKARAIENAITPLAMERPGDHAFFLAALDFRLGPSYEVVIAGDPSAEDTKAMLSALRSRFIPRKVVLMRPPGDSPPIATIAPFTKHQAPIGGRATAYVCVNNACKSPSSKPADMLKAMGVK